MAEYSQTGERGAETKVDAESEPVQRLARSATAAAAQRAEVVQRVAKPGNSPASVQATAARGVAGSGGALPHGAVIQQAFGRHDISGVQAHVGGAAGEAAQAIGAQAYATGNDIAFSGQPDLHTAAHEAAHVVQQRAGVQLKGGVGESGDVYERHADAVADAVVAGQSAEGLLDQHAGGGGTSAVQRQDETAGGGAGGGTATEGGATEGEQTPDDPLEAFKQALQNGDATEAWSAYNTIPPPDRSQISPEEVEQAVALFYPAQGLAAIQLLFEEYGVAPIEQLNMCDRAGILDGELAYLLANTPGNTPAQQVEIANDPGLMVVIVSLGGRLPHEFFEILAADPVAFIGACASDNPLSQWVAQDNETLKLVTDALPDYAEWSKAFQANNAWDRLLEMCELEGTPAAQWRAGVLAGSGFSWVVDNAAKPVDDKYVAGLWALYGDGSGIAVGDKYTMWQCLYRARLVTAAENVETWRSEWDDANGWHHTRVRYYHGVAPNDQAMDLFYTQFKQIPRVQIDLAATVVMCDYRLIRHDLHKPAETFLFWETSPAQDRTIWEDNTGNAQASQAAAIAAGRLTTSYYNGAQNVVLMQSTNANGAPSTNAVPTVGTGDGRGGSAVNEQYDEAGNLVGGLNYFQNHATHEIGHAVGNKRLQKDGINTTGDAYAQTYANWQQNGNATQYARQLGWDAAMDGTTYALTVGATTANVIGTDIRLWLVSRVGGPAPAGTNQLTTNFGGNEMAAIKSDGTLAANILVRTVERDGSPGSAFRMRYGIPNASGSVHVFSSRWGNQFVTYDKTAWDDRVSHYSVSSPKEMFAEIYTAHYTGGGVPGGMQPFFDALDTAEQEHFPDENPGAGGGPGDADGGGGGGGDTVDPDGGPLPPEDAPWPS